MRSLSLGEFTAVSGGNDPTTIGDEALAAGVMASGIALGSSSGVISGSTTGVAAGGGLIGAGVVPVTLGVVVFGAGVYIGDSIQQNVPMVRRASEAIGEAAFAVWDSMYQLGQ